MSRLGDWLDQRTGHRAAVRFALDEPVLGGASFAYVFGSVLTFLLLLQLTTGLFLAMTYSPSATDAWASVAYVQDQVTLGWFVRGLHAHGASAMVVVAGLHMMQTALYGAYRKPRELNWIVGVAMLGLILAFALTGYLLPWDQTGYWATKVATGIAGTSPVVGAQVQQILQGGNEYGNLTLTRFFAIHVLLLPAALVGLVVLHLVLFRRHGATPHWWLSPEQLERRARPFWPDQMFRDMVAMAVVFAALVAVNLVTGGAPLDAPADPSSGFDARPEWYFRPLFQALKYFEGPLEQVVALGMPVVLGGFLLALPFWDRGPSRAPAARAAQLGGLGALALVMAVLTVVSMREDAADPAYQHAAERAEVQARRARTLAVQHGVPAAGGTAVYATAPFHRAKRIWRETCVGCHQGAERIGPEIAAGYNSRAWIQDFLRDPHGDRFFGRTRIDKMKPVQMTGEPLDAIVEFIYAQGGDPAIDPAKVAYGAKLFADGDCSGCHAVDGQAEGETGPNLGGRGRVETLAELIGRPDHPRWFGKASEMPPFYDQLDRATRLELAAFLVQLRDMRPAPIAPSSSSSPSPSPSP